MGDLCRWERTGPDVIVVLVRSSTPLSKEPTMKKLFPAALVLLGVILLVAGGYTAKRGFEAKDLVRSELIAQKITTPEDASIPNARVDDPATAKSMADIIDEHARKATGGKTYSELDRNDPTRATA
jgi:hypothetical protein